MNELAKNRHDMASVSSGTNYPEVDIAFKMSLILSLFKPSHKA